MRKYITGILCIFIGNCFAQANTIDGLKHLLQNEREDSNRCRLYEKLSVGYQYYKPDTALLLAGEGLELAKKINFAKGEVFCLSRIGNIFTLTGNDAKALELLLQVLKKSETIDDPALVAQSLISISHVYYDQGDYKKELDYLLQAKRIAFEMKDEHQSLVCSNDIGDCYERLNQLDSAKLYMAHAYDLAVKLKDEDFIGTALNNFGNIFSKMKLNSTAMANYRLALLYLTKTNDYESICETSLGIAKLFLGQKQDDSCLHYSKISYTTAREYGFTTRLLNASVFLAEYYKQHNANDSSYRYLISVIAAKDTLFNQEKIREIQNLGFNETLRKQEIAEQKKADQEESKRNLQRAGIAVFIPLFFLFVLLLSRTKVKGRTVEFLAIVGLLLFFEFITDLLYPYISNWTNESPIWETLIFVIIAAGLEPISYRVERWIKRRLVHRTSHVAKSIETSVE